MTLPPRQLPLSLTIGLGLLVVLAVVPTAPAVEIDIGNGVGVPGDFVNIEVTLRSNGAEVAATTNDVIFDPAVADINGLTACKINPAISAATGSCPDDPTTGPCKVLSKAIVTCPGPDSDPCPTGSQGKKRFRGTVLSTANTTTIPDGALYTCTFAISLDAIGRTDLIVVNAIAADPSGTALATIGHDGAIVFVPTPTSTPTPTPMPTATPRVVHIDIGPATGAPQDAVNVNVSLTTSGVDVAATVNDINFDPQVLALDPATCRLNGATDSTIAANAVQAGTIRVFVQPGPSKALLLPGPLYTCTFRIAPGAPPDTYSITNANTRAFDAAGDTLDHVVGGDGSVTVSLVDRSCPGDCSGDRRVSVDELVSGVSIALGNSPTTTCLQFDANGDGKVTVDELVAAVNRALRGC